MKISFGSTSMKTNFHNKNFRLNLAFKTKFKVTRKWLIPGLFRNASGKNLVCFVALTELFNTLRGSLFTNRTIPIFNDKNDFFEKSFNDFR